MVWNKAGYTATEVACGWAGAIFEVTRPFGQEQWGQRNKIIKKVKRDRPTDWPTDKPTNRWTGGQSGLLSRVHATKNLLQNQFNRNLILMSLSLCKCRFFYKFNNPVFTRLPLPQNSFISIFPLLFFKDLPIPLLSNQRCCIQLQNQYHTIPLYQYHGAY